MGCPGSPGARGSGWWQERPVRLTTVVAIQPPVGGDPRPAPMPPGPLLLSVPDGAHRPRLRRVLTPRSFLGSQEGHVHQRTPASPRREGPPVCKAGETRGAQRHRGRMHPGPRRVGSRGGGGSQQGKRERGRESGNGEKRRRKKSKLDGGGSGRRRTYRGPAPAASTASGERCWGAVAKPRSLFLSPVAAGREERVNREAVLEPDGRTHF